MEHNNKLPAKSLPQHFKSDIKIDDLLSMTNVMEKDLQDSQEVLDQIKKMFGNVSKDEASSSNDNSKATLEDLSQFLAAASPTILMPGMSRIPVDDDLDDIIASMKGYTEDLRKNYVVVEPKKGYVQKDINNIDLTHYASSLDQLVKQLGNINLNKEIVADRNTALEEKLTQLCEDVSMFTKMVEEKSKQSETNKLWRPMEEDNSALYYDNMINKLLLGINEVTHLLNNRN